MPAKTKFIPAYLQEVQPMSLLDQKLAALPIGSHVRLVHKSGQIIEGVVMENDGKDALSVQITSTATLRYDQIGILEECTQAGIPQPKPAADPVLQAAPVQPAAVPAPAAPKQKPVSGFENMQIPCDKEAVTQAFKAMESQEKKALTTGYNKYVNYLQSHETSKCQEAVQLAWNVIEENEWDYNPRVNFFLGLLQLVCEDYDMAAESLFYAGNLRYAYCAAYQGAQKKEEWEYALLAAAFAALFLSEDNALGKEEAAEVLQKSSVQLADISGITYALEHAVEESSRAALNRIIRSIGVDHGKTTAELQDIQALLESLRYLFPGNAVRKKSPNCKATRWNPAWKPNQNLWTCRKHRLQMMSRISPRHTPAISFLMIISREREKFRVPTKNSTCLM